MEAAMPGATRTAVRRATIDFIQAVAFAICRDISEDPQLVATAGGFVQDYLKDTVALAASPDTTVSCDGVLLDSQSLGWMTNITRSTGLSFLCRRRGYYGWNHGWAVHPDHEWFRCPSCAGRYFPYASKGAVTKANKAIWYPTSSGDLKVTMIMWPSSAEHKFFNKMVEAHALKIGALSDPQKWVSRSMDQMKEYATRCGAPAVWEKFPWRSHLEWGPFKQPDTGGFFEGGHADLSGPVETDLDAVVALFGNLVAGVKALSSRL
jgi:hypothetical protein